MWRYLKLHEAFVTQTLQDASEGVPWAALLVFHERQLRYLQHERLIHLLVTLFVATFFLLCLGYVTLNHSLPGVALCGLLLVLLAAYIVHYFRLENGIQRWYHLSNRLSEKSGAFGAAFDGGITRSFGHGGRGAPS